MSGKGISRREFVQKLIDSQPDVRFFTPKSKIPQEMHNPAQDIADFCAKFGEKPASNVRTVIDGHLVDISWNRTLVYIRGLAETQR